METPAERRALGTTLRRARRERQWSQEVLAEHAEVHRNYVGLVERGEISPTVDNLARLARALSLRPSALLRRAGL